MKNSKNKLSNAYSFLSLLKIHCEILSEEVQITIIGGGKRYIFDIQGNLINCITTDKNFDEIQVSGAEGNPHPLNNPLGPTSASTNYPQSGSSFNGDGVDMDAFKYLANNTNVEWAYCYKEGEPGGYLTTSNQQHCVGLPSSKSFKDYGYDGIIHNHSQDLSGLGYSRKVSIEYNKRPSNEDVKRLEDYNFKSGFIYNEIDKKNYGYGEGYETQEEYAKENNIEIE